MMEPQHGAGDPAGATPARTSAEVTLGERRVRLERLSGLKLTRALAIMRQASSSIPPLIERWGTFAQEYARTHSVELDRATALMRYGPEPLYVDGELIRDEQGLPRMSAGRLAHLTEEDWQARGNVLRIPVAPSTPEAVAAILPEALELAEAHVFELLGLLAMPNADVVRYWKAGELPDRLAEYVDELLEAPADDLLELAVVAAELIDEQMRRKASSLGDRLGNLLRLFGLDPSALRTPTPAGSPAPSTSSSSSSPQTSSTASPSSTDGPPTSPSAPPSTSSRASDDEPELEQTPPPPATMEEEPALR